MGGGVGVWRMVGRGRKEKDLMVGQISFYVFCCCVVRMDGFVQNRINELVQRHFSLDRGLVALSERLSLRGRIVGTCQRAGRNPRCRISKYTRHPCPTSRDRTRYRQSASERVLSRR